MSFQNPALLYGLFALAVPIIIHFFNFRRTRKIYFSNTQFLKKVKESEATKKRLKHYLILASRLLFLFFLVMAFAQPFLPSDQEGAAGLPVTVYLDNSFSMSNEVEEGMPAMDRGIANLDELLRLMPQTTEFRLLTNEFRGNSRTLQSKRELEEAFTELSFSSIPRTANEVISRLNADVRDEKMNLFWVSDFQETTLGAAEAILDSSYLVNIVPMRFSNLSNVYVDSLYVMNPIMITDERVELHVIFRNIGPREVNELIAKVYVDGVQSGTANVNLDPNGRREIVFDLSVDRSTAHECQIIFEEFPVTFDNEFNFVINIPEKINILEIKSREEVTPIGLVYANQDLFNLTSQLASNLNYNLINLSDLVVISELEEIDNALAAALNAYEAAGGTLLLIPPATMNPAAYGSVRSAGMANVDDSAAVVSLSPPDFDNPFFANVFEETSDRIQMPEAKKSVTWQNRAQSLLTYTSGGSFLSQRIGQGTTYLMGSSLDVSSGNFSRHALFVPVMYKIAASAKTYSSELYKFTSETTFTFRHDSASINDLYALVRGEQRIIPEQRIEGKRVLFSVPRFTISSGFYDLYYGDNLKGRLAFNLDPEESDIRQVPQDQLSGYFTGARFQTLEGESSERFASAISERYVGTPLWREALILALLFFLAEVLLVRFMP